MTIVEFGNIIRKIREEILFMTQKELAMELKTAQAVISRLEKGKGGTIPFVLELLTFFQKKGVKSHMIFFEPFDLSYVNPNKKQQMVKEIDTLVQLMKKL